MSSLLDPHGIEKFDRAQERKEASFARLVRQFVRAADNLVWETQAVAKWEPGTKRFTAAVKRLELAAAKYNELRQRVINCCEVFG